MTANCKKCKLVSGSDVITENFQLAIFFFTNTNNEILLVLVVLNVFITAW